VNDSPTPKAVERETSADVLIRLKRPEGYEDVDPELILEDANINPAFEPELVAASVQGLEAPPECKTDEEKRAFCFGWFKAMEKQRAPDVQGAFVRLRRPSSTAGTARSGNGTRKGRQPI
jgi:hypothetical protein